MKYISNHKYNLFKKYEAFTKYLPLLDTHSARLSYQVLVLASSRCY